MNVFRKLKWMWCFLSSAYIHIRKVIHHSTLKYNHAGNNRMLLHNLPALNSNESGWTIGRRREVHLPRSEGRRKARRTATKTRKDENRFFKTIFRKSISKSVRKGDRISNVPPTLTFVAGVLLVRWRPFSSEGCNLTDEVEPTRRVEVRTSNVEKREKEEN